LSQGCSFEQTLFYRVFVVWQMLDFAETLFLFLYFSTRFLHPHWGFALVETD
jgi:hypothetical protein